KIHTITAISIATNTCIGPNGIPTIKEDMRCPIAATNIPDFVPSNTTTTSAGNASSATLPTTAGILIIAPMIDKATNKASKLIFFVFIFSSFTTVHFTHLILLLYHSSVAIHPYDDIDECIDVTILIVFQYHTKLYQITRSSL